jgi:antitoxin VapB
MADHFKTEADKMRRELDEILHRVDQLPVLDDRSPEEIIGYDENGLPSS